MRHKMKTLTLLLALLGIKREVSIEKITKPMARIVSKLEDYAAEQTLRSQADAETAANLLKKSEEETKAAEEARALATRYSSLTV